MTRRRIVIVAVFVVVLIAFAALGVFGFVIPSDCNCGDDVTLKESLDSTLHLFLLQVALTKQFDEQCDCDVDFNLNLLPTGQVTQGNSTIMAYVVPVKRVENSLIASTIGKVWTYRDVDFYFVWESA